MLQLKLNFIFTILRKKTLLLNNTNFYLKITQYQLHKNKSVTW